MGNVLSEMLDWSKSRPVWQRHCLRQLVSGDEPDNDLLFKLCKQPHGLNPASEVVTPIPLTDAHVPAGAGTTAIRLTSVEGAENVNALAAGQRLVFGTTALTVVYGDNAAGKSGYARILKAACRARGTPDAVLPNVTVHGARAKPTAKVCWHSGDEANVASWQLGAPTEDALSRVSIFDSKSAAAYVSQRHDVAYRPLGLDVFDRLAEVCERLRRMLDVEKAAFDTPRSLPALDRNTEAGSFLAALSDKSEEASIDALILPPDGVVELKRLKALRDELVAANPAARLEQLKHRLDRVKKLDGFIGAFETRLGEKALVALDAAQTACKAAEGALAVLRAETFGKAVPNVGEAAWRTLWESACRYAEAGNGSFPDASSGAKCPLCLTTLDHEAQTRIDGLRHFVEGDAAKVAAQARSRLDELREGIQKLAFDHQSIRDALADIAELPWSGELKVWMAGARRTHGDVLRALDSSTSAMPTSGTIPDRTLLKQLLDEWSAGIAILEKGVHDVKTLRDLEQRIAELDARLLLTERKDDVIGEVRRLRTVGAYKRCRVDLDTAAITRKSTELTQHHVSETLRAAFATECQRLRFRTVDVELKPVGGARGALYHQVQLRGSNVTLPHVLSEGEARCLSIAAFFAELEFIEPKSGMVFDDPVSSLDHHWRDAVASRLVAEAAKRQVIVFTHDVFFLFLLQEAAKRAGLPIHHQHLSRSAQGAGHCTNTLPWSAMRTGERIGALRSAWQAADALERKATRGQYEKEAANIYGLLREAWERAVEEVLLGDVVVRFRPSVETRRARELTDIVEDDLQQLTDGMSKCSMWLAGHDHATGLGQQMPSAGELKGDIDAFVAWVDGIKKRRK